MLKEDKKPAIVEKTEKKEVRQFVVFVNQSDKEKERDKIKRTLGVTAGTVVDAVIRE